MEHGTLLLAIAATPFLLFPAMVPLATATMLLLWTGWWLLCWVRRGYAVAPTLLDPLIVALLAVAPLGLWGSTDDGLALGTLSRFLLGVLWYYGINETVATPAALRLPVALLAGFGALFSLLGLTATAWQPEKVPFLASFYQILPSLRLSGPVAGTVNGISGFFHPNMIAGTLLLLLPVVWGGRTLWGQRRRWVARAQGAVALVMVVVVLLTLSRTAWLVLLVGTLLFALRAVLWRRWRGLLAGGVFLLLALTLSRSLWVDRLLGTRAAGSWRTRVEVWDRALQTLRDFPLTGIGLGHFEPLTRQFYPYQVAPDAWHFGHAHNLWLQVGVEWGWFGMVAWVGIIGGVLWRLLRVGTHLPPHSPLASLATGLTVSLVAYNLFGLVDALPWGTKPGFLVWLVLGIAVALLRLAVPVALPPPPGARRWHPLALLVGTLALVPLLRWLVPLNVGMRDLLRADPTPLRAPTQAEATVLLAWARAPRWPGSPTHPPSQRLAAWYAQRGALDRALDWNATTVARHPTAPVLAQRAALLAARGDAEGAAAAYQAALAVAPGDLAIARRAAELALARGAPADARAMLRAALAAAPVQDEDFFLARGELARIERDWPAAQQAYATAAARWPKPPTLLWAGVAAIEAGDPAAALPFLERQLRQDPFDGWAHFHAGRAHEALGVPAAAERAYREAMRVSQGLSPAAQALGRLLVAQERPDEAIAPLTMATRSDPKNPAGWLWLARAAALRGDVAAARAAYTTLLRLQPDQAEATTYLSAHPAP